MKKAFIPKDNFDAEVVTIVDREFESDKPFLTTVASRATSTYADFDDNVWQFWNLQRKVADQAWLKKAKGKKYAGRKGSYQEIVRKYNNYEKTLKEKHTNEIMEVLMEGRLKIAFLIDSDGGSTELLGLYTDALKALDQRSHSQAYVTGHASSAALDLTMKSNQALMLDKSHLFWHFSGEPQTRRESVEKLKKNLEMPRREHGEILELREYFDRSKHIDDKYFDYLLEVIQREENPEGELIFCGRELAELNLVRSYKDIQSLRRRFNSEYMARIDEPIKEFWNISEKIIEEIGDGIWEDFFTEAMRADWKGYFDKTQI